jgi:hypothetical protein
MEWIYDLFTRWPREWSHWLCVNRGLNEAVHEICESWNENKCTFVPCRWAGNGFAHETHQEGFSQRLNPAIIIDDMQSESSRRRQTG